MFNHHRLRNNHNMLQQLYLMNVYGAHPLGQHHGYRITHPLPQMRVEVISFKSRIHMNVFIIQVYLPSVIAVISYLIHDPRQVSLPFVQDHPCIRISEHIYTTTHHSNKNNNRHQHHQHLLLLLVPHKKPS